MAERLLNKVILDRDGEDLWALVHEANLESAALFAAYGFVRGEPFRPGSRYRRWSRAG